jgi:N utilization substance protein A
MNTAIVEAIQQLTKEKDIDKDAFQELIQGVFLSVIKRNYGTSDNFDVIFNMEKGDIEIYCEKEIVEDGEVEDEVTQVEISKAKEEDPDFEVGDDYVEIVDYKKFGRRSILAIKQNLIQRIKEIEKENLFNEFAERIGEIVIGDIHQVSRREIRMNIDKTEVILPREEQIYNERYRMGQSMRCIIKEVRRTSKEPEIVVSRADASFIKRLFELEVPEIYDNIIEIKDIARDAGDRTKIAVASNDNRIDPVGACVGMKGVRIQAIVKELNNEKIDIIAWSDNLDQYIRRAIAPVTPTEVSIDYANKKAVVVVPDENIASAVGKKGQNIRLASKLVNFELDMVKESDYYEEEIEVSSVDAISPAIRSKLEEAGYQYVDEIIDGGIERLMEIPGIGKVTATGILETLEKLYEEDNAAEKPAESETTTPDESDETDDTETVVDENETSETEETEQQASDKDEEAAVEDGDDEEETNDDLSAESTEEQDEELK